MASTTASVGSGTAVRGGAISKDQIFGSIGRLYGWLEKNDYKGYDTFDGLSARYVRWLTFENKFLRQVLQQGIRRFPFNTRPMLGVKKDHASKAMGYFAKGFIRLHQATGEQIWADKAAYALQWLIDNSCKGYSGSCWGNHFDYQSRSFYMDKSVPTIVWTSHIGHAFLDAYEHFGNEKYLQVAASACEHIVRDLEVRAKGDGVCISYVPTLYSPIHNSNTLGASLLARTYSHTRNESYRSLAQKAMRYAANHQRANASWYYGEKANLHWVDNFHTAYVLDCFKYYREGTGDRKFDGNLTRGYDYWKKTFFLEDGTPRYYDFKKLPLDIQCSSQAIDTLVFFGDRDPDAIPLALKIAKWTIDNMQDSTGYFYYRRYALGMVNKTPTLHWGQATMLSALSGLYKLLQ
jgi:polysaccharide biosynthesis protein VpsJ